MKNYNHLSDDDILHRYFMAQDSGGYFLKQEIPRLHKEMQQRGII